MTRRGAIASLGTAVSLTQARRLPGGILTRIFFNHYRFILDQTAALWLLCALNCSLAFSQSQTRKFLPRLLWWNFHICPPGGRP